LARRSPLRAGGSSSGPRDGPVGSPRLVPQAAPRAPAPSARVTGAATSADTATTHAARHLAAAQAASTAPGDRLTFVAYHTRPARPLGETGKTGHMTTAPNVPSDLQEELYATCVEVAKGAAEVLVSYTGRRLEHVEAKSSPTDLVSEADRASEQFIVERLNRLRPTDSLFGEEGASQEGSSGISWWADPLDGTTNFLFGVPAWSVSLAAKFEGRTIAGAVVDPSRNETWSAAAGRGAWCNGHACHVAEGRSELCTALVATGFGYSRERRAEQAALLGRVLPAVRDIRRVGSAALDLAWVAGGRYDAFYEAYLNPWDWAAGALICEEAGGAVTMLPGELLLASTQSLSAPMASLLIGP
jgi:myo-inositol-1(or 4)-monophosphatase